MKRLELGLTDVERRQRTVDRKARNCGLAICFLLVALGLFIDLTK